MSVQKYRQIHRNTSWCTEKRDVYTVIPIYMHTLLDPKYCTDACLCRCLWKHLNICKHAEYFLGIQVHMDIHKHIQIQRFTDIHKIMCVYWSILMEMCSAVHTFTDTHLCRQLCVDQYVCMQLQMSMHATEVCTTQEHIHLYIYISMYICIYHRHAEFPFILSPYAHININIHTQRHTDFFG